MALKEAAPPPLHNLPAKLGEKWNNLFGFVRDIRAEAQDLKKSLFEIKEIKEKSIVTVQLITPEIKEALNKEVDDNKLKVQLLQPEVKNALNKLKSEEIFEYNREKISKCFESLRMLLNESPEIYDYVGDEITKIECYWERVYCFWPHLPLDIDKINLDELFNNLDKVDSLLDEIIFHASKITIPHRISHHLESLRIGQPLDFHETFEDELPKYEERVKVLRYINSHPKIVEGVVDVDNGKIYHASPNIRRRYMSFAVIGGVILLGGILVFVFSNMGSWLNLKDWPVTFSFTELIVAYFFILIGAFVHIGVEGVKQYRANQGQTFLAIENWLLWIHIKEVPIIMSIISLWIGFFGLALLLQNVGWQTAFFVGYSIDSFVDLFIGRFTNTISTRTQTLKEQLN